MDNESVIEILNDLLAYESQCLIPRLGESTVFFSWASSEEQRIISSMVREAAEHRRWLVQAILDIGGESLPVLADIRSTSVHYVDLSSLLHKALRDVKRLMAVYHSAAEQVGSNERAVSVINRITERLNRHAGQLSRLSERIQSQTF